jgi:cytochrome c55X
MAEITDVRQLELHNILKQDCGSCHGLTLKGGLGPALTTVAMKKKPRSVMLATILDGRAGTPMPPWKSILSREEVDWLLDVLYGGSSRDQ